MSKEGIPGERSFRVRRGHAIAAMAGAALALGTSGCTLTLAPLAKHTAVFSSATAVVVDGSKKAYLTANELHRNEQLAAAVDGYGSAGWSPYTATKPLLTAEQLAARVKVLDALSAYAAALDKLTETKNREKKLDDAASAAGTNLQSLTAVGAPKLQRVFPGFAGLSADEANGVSTAIDGLGKLLTNRSAKRALARTTVDADPYVQALCKLIESDAEILRTQADVDYRTPITKLDQFIQHNTIDPGVRRTEVRRLILLAQQQQMNDGLLGKLEESVGALAKAHAALRDAAAGKDPATVKQRLEELISFGTELGTYYDSLSATTGG